jgi:cell wall-associated NlpC family hydrolase
MSAVLSASPRALLRPAGRLVAVAVTALLAGAMLSVPAGAAAATTTSTPASQTITPGATATITTRVTSGGLAVAGRPVILLSYLSGTWYQRGSVATSATGHASFRYAPTGSRTVALVFRADARYAASRSANFRITVQRSIVSEAARHRGKPYRWGATGPSSFDCSGYTGYVYRQVGRSLPRTSGMQRGATRRVAAADRRPGDLVFVHSSSGAVFHVAIYSGNGYWWESPKPGSYVRNVRIWSSRVSYGRL